jgi:2-polyprenyl-6-methoxyphenol hydroxylase-like FAD-dependent oxidoreductase
LISLKKSVYKNESEKVNNIQSALMTKSKTFAIVGGGIGGLTLAIALQKKGFQTKVYESAPEIRPVGAGIVLAANALKAYKAIGLDEEVIAAGKTMKSFCIRDSKGGELSKTEVNRVFKEYGAFTNLALHRADLHAVLQRNLRAGTLELNKSCESFDEEQGKVRLTFKDGTRTSEDYVIAADGIHSVFRRSFLKDSQLRYSGYTCWRGITTALPAEFNFDQATETWGAGKRFGIVPLKNGKVYWFATLNAPKNDSVTSRYSGADLQKLFAGFHFPVRAIIAGTRPEDIIKNDIIDIPPIKKYAFGKVVLLGDAAHATTPNLGQGACMAIEDAVVLAHCLGTYDEPKIAFLKYEERRLTRTTRIVNTSYQMGKVAQVENPMLVMLRNMLIRFTPDSVTDKQLRFLFDVQFS